MTSTTAARVQMGVLQSPADRAGEVARPQLA
jgi:hypothetical protein